MVRTTGLSYEISPKNNINQRITNIRTNNGKPLNYNKKYVVTGWASVNSEEDGEPIWDITRQYLSDIKYYDLTEVTQPKILQEGDNFGIET